MRSYASALRHFEVEWQDTFRPPQTVWRGTWPPTRRPGHQHAAASPGGDRFWHRDHGFVDPTRSPLVRKVLKGIQTLHPTRVKQAAPLQIRRLVELDDWLAAAIAAAHARGDGAAALRHQRDRALVLLGFWRGFRGDELLRLEVAHLTLVPGQGMTCFLPRSKGDRQAAGVTHKVPALSRLCPVEATQVWLQAANVQDGPVFRAINQWGHVSAEGLHPNSLVRLLRELLASAGFADAGLHSSHSLRRGFASWANDQGWDMKALMEYVGWRDVQSAMRYRTGVTRSPGIALKRACPAQPRQLRRWRCRRRGQICPAAAPTHGADPVCPRRPRPRPGQNRRDLLGPVPSGAAEHRQQRVPVDCSHRSRPGSG